MNIPFLNDVTVTGVVSTAAGTSQNWNSNYTTTNTNSGKWSDAYTNLTANSANYLSGYNMTLLTTTSGKWDSNYTTTNTNSASWGIAYSNLTANSANYLSGYDMTLLTTTSAKWDSNYTTTNNNSASWNNAYSNLTANSANYLSGYDMSLLTTTSAKWNSNYTTTNTNSASWNAVYTSYNSISSRYTTLDYLSTNTVLLSSMVVGPSVANFSLSTPVSAMSGMYVNATGNAGFGTNVPVATMDVRGNTTIVGFSAFGQNPTCLRMRDNYLYALCTGNNTLNVFDTSTSVPQFVASATTEKLGAYSTMAMQGRYAYVTTASGVQSFDVTGTTPVSAGIIGTQSYTSQSYFVPGTIVTQGKYAYAYYNPPIAGYNTGTLCTIDISDATKLAHVTAPASNYFGGNGNFTVQGNALYLGYSFIGGSGVYQVNLAANPAPISFTASLIQSGTVSSAYSLAAQGRYLYYVSYNAFYVLDLSLTGSSRVIATLVFPSGFFTSSDMVVQQQYAYVMRASGVFVINISNPRAPVIVRIIPIVLHDSSYRGMVIKGRTMYITDGTTNAIFKIDLGGAYVQQLEAGGIQTEHVFANNMYAANEIAAAGGGSFGGGLNVQGAVNVVGVVAATGGNSTNWNSSYTNLTANSASWNSNYTTTNTNSGKWDSNYTTTNANSANWSSTCLAFAVTDEFSYVTAGNNKITFTIPYNFTLTKVKAGANEAPVSQSLSVALSSLTNLNTAATVTIPAGNLVADSAALTYALVENDRMTVNVTQADGTPPGKGLKVYLIGKLS